MRKTILMTAAIALIAVAMAIGVFQSDNIKTFVANSPWTNHFAPQVAATDTTMTTEMASTETPAPTTQTVEETQVAATEMPATNSEGSGMTPVDLDTLAAATPAAGDEKFTPPPETASAGDFKLDVPMALKERSLGSPTAPVTVYDYSSLTCPHCANFHLEILPKIKENYIDKGKVRWVYRTFPLNEPAVRAEMVVRCAPEEQYFKLSDMLYKNQERWAFTNEPIPYLGMLVKIAGFDEAKFLACINNKELEEGVLKIAQNGTDKFKINSTPTFVINDDPAKVISGAGTYEAIADDLDREYGKAIVDVPKSTPIPQQ